MTPPARMPKEFVVGLCLIVAVALAWRILRQRTAIEEPVAALRPPVAAAPASPAEMP